MSELHPEKSPQPAPPPFRRADSAQRKTFPLFSGLLAYFPDALAAVAHISYLGNEKHNKGLPLHWAREKSNDHLDCAARHLIQAQWKDDENEDHLAEAIWRLLAEKQLRLESKHILSAPRNAVDPHLDVKATILT